MIQAAAIEQLAAGFHGRLIEPSDPEYDRARALYNGMIDKRPRLIAQCRNVSDVISAVRFGREQRLLVAVRGGGHNGPGLGSCDDGLVIDLSMMTGVHVDPRSCTVRAEPGCTQGDVDHATHVFGLAVPAGIVSTTGIAGLTLGGGHGYLTRQHGLTIDNLLEVDVVLADGRFVTASKSQHEDLFWALRGGGGNFGVVTSFVYRAHPVTDVYAGPVFWRLEDAPRVMAWYREFLPTAAPQLGAFLGLKTVPSTDPFPREIWGRRICALISCYDGSSDEAEHVLKSMRTELPPPILDGLTTMPFPTLQGLFDPLLPPGLQWYWKGHFVKELSDEAIETHVKQAAQSPTELSLMHLYPIDGAVHRVAPGETAWATRDARWSMVIAGIDPDPAKAEALQRWGRNYWEAVRPFCMDSAYVNFMMAEGADRVEATYGGNYERLRQVKARYDPDNFFRVNQNITPAMAVQ
jgi:hypothetical protein